MKDKQTCFITLYRGMFRRNHCFLNKERMNAINTALFIQARPFAFFDRHWNSCGEIRGQDNKSTSRWNTAHVVQRKLKLAKRGSGCDTCVQSLIAWVQWQFCGNSVDKVLREFSRCTFKKTDSDKVMNITNTNDNNKTGQNEWYVHENSSRMLRQDVVNDFGTKISHWPWVAQGGAQRVRIRLQRDNCARVEPLVKSYKIHD